MYVRHKNRADLFITLLLISTWNSRAEAQFEFIDMVAGNKTIELSGIQVHLCPFSSYISSLCDSQNFDCLFVFILDRWCSWDCSCSMSRSWDLLVTFRSIWLTHLVYELTWVTLSNEMKKSCDFHSLHSFWWEAEAIPESLTWRRPWKPLLTVVFHLSLSGPNLSL